MKALLLILIWWMKFHNCTCSEPTCYSRYDYDHKVMMSLVSLELRQKQFSDMLNEQLEETALLRKDLKETQLKNVELLEGGFRTGTHNMGATYVRFGRTACPFNGTELVYEGYVGGSHFTQTGGAVNYLCLPKDPLWGHFDGSNQVGGHMYGSEYEFSGRDRENFFGKEVRDRDVPCAVCRTNRSSVLMIPARNKCYDGWTREYHGYLTAGNSGHNAASEFACLDIDPEVIGGGSADKDGKLFYFVEAKCGSLRCPPYVANREFTCVVCSK